MPVISHLSAQLAAAAEHDASRRRRRRRGRLAAISTAGVLAVAGVASAATDLWDPQLGDDVRGHPSSSASSPPRAELDALGVLRRAPSDADRGAQARYALRWLDPSLHGVRVDAVRLVGVGEDDRGFVLVPVEETDRTRDALCLFAQDTAGGGMSCFSLADVESGHAVLGIGQMPASIGPRARRPASRDRNRADGFRPLLAKLTGVVPDGVAAVRLGTASAPVHDNFFQLSVTGADQRPDALEWLDDDGRLIPKR